jgi:hypothetical protein
MVLSSMSLMPGNYGPSLFPLRVASILNAQTPSNRLIRSGRAALTTSAHDLGHLISRCTNSSVDLGDWPLRLDMDGTQAFHQILPTSR